MFKLPKVATAPFCPSEVQGCVQTQRNAPLFKKILTFCGPGLLVSVGYMDPGNWATDIEGGSRFGYALLWIVALSSLIAILLQVLSAKLGVITRTDLARACRNHYSTGANRCLWIMAELAIIACDVAEVLGTALALHLLLGLSLLAGVLVTAFDTVLVLGLKGHGFRQIEAIVLGLIGTIGACFAVQIALVGPDWHAVLSGLTPTLRPIMEPDMLYLSIGILGATVMPHNLYLHSSIIQTRKIAQDEASQRDALRMSTLDTIGSLSLAFLVNAAILILSAAVFHASGHQNVTDIQEAYHLLDPLVGGGFASLLFGLALLASGQSSTFTGTIAGQVLMEGFLDLKIPCWQRRLITRALALIPALIGVWWLGEAGVGKMLVASQVVLSFQLPFAIWPLICFTSSKKLMGVFANGTTTRIAAWSTFILICAANLWLFSALI
jgi:manganese transport protein